MKYDQKVKLQLLTNLNNRSKIMKNLKTITIEEINVESNIVTLQEKIHG